MQKDIEHHWESDPTIAQAVEGQDGQLVTTDLTVKDLLRLVVIELRKMNVQLSILTNEEVNDYEIEGPD